mmetsp:Transcript_18822/g.52583  ORF Transcript_18822/g.52583 Transcript_18822/m.52583 type:complete len:542 (+) Transcript_18822:269-1894(+)
MTPREYDALIPDDESGKTPSYGDHLSIGYDGSSQGSDNGNDNDNDSDSQTTPHISNVSRCCPRTYKYDDGDDDGDGLGPHVSISSRACGRACLLLVLILAVAVVSVAVSDPLDSGIALQKLRSGIHSVAEALAEQTAPVGDPIAARQGKGPYELIEAHRGKSFFDYYEFHDGPDSVGSAGYNSYVGRKRAEKLDLIRFEGDDSNNDNNNDDNDNHESVLLYSKAGSTYDENGDRLRESIRLEGKRRFDHGLILLDVDKMPSGCGVWPAFWSTDEAVWPDHGEIDIVEPINNQDVAKTALHAAEGCDMYAHVPRYNWTGHWDSATGIPDTFTGALNFDNAVQADNCWTNTPHQWYNQGCVAIHERNGTIGEAMNEKGGGVYALEWDPSGGYIRAWVFPRDGIPDNLREALSTRETDGKGKGSGSNGSGKIDGSGNGNGDSQTRPDPSQWPLPYAYFAIGEGTGCPSERFQNHRLVFNLAFCGQVAGNRFARDCPALYEKFNVNNDSIATCNAYLDSDEARAWLDSEVYWKIRGVYLYQREHE